MYIKFYFSFLLVQREKKVNVSKLIGSLRDLYFKEIFISFLHMCMFPACCFCQRKFSYLLVFFFLLGFGTRPYKWGTQ